MIPRPFRSILALLLAACGGAPDALPGPAVRDSAGVAVVDNADLAPDLAWASLRVVPDLEIGGPGDDVIFGQIVDLDIAADGQMLVVDQIERAIRIFRADGTPLPTIGRAGEGPGEFSRFVNGVVVTGDTLLVTDWGHQRMTRFDLDGVVLATDPLPTPGGTRSWWRRAPDGSLRARVLRRLVEDGRWSGDDVLIAMAHPTARVDTVLRFAYRHTDIGGPGAIKAALIINTPSWAVLPDGAIVWTALELGELRVHDADGALARIIRRDAWTPTVATPADRDHLISLLGDRLERLGGSRATVGQLDIPPVDNLPVLTSVLSGPDGTLWAQRAAPPAAFHAMSINAPELPAGFGGVDWDILDRTGRYLATIALPAGVQVMRFHDDAIYGIRRDELGVETLVRLRLDGLPL